MTAIKFEVSGESLPEDGVSIDYPIISPQKAELMASQVRLALKDSGKRHVVITGKTHFSIGTEVLSYISSQRKDRRSLFLALAPTSMMAYGLYKLVPLPKEKGPGASYKIRFLEDVCEDRPIIFDDYSNCRLLAIGNLYEYLNQIILTSKIPVGTITDEWDTFYTYSRSFDPSVASIIFINDIELFPTEQLILLMFILHEMRRRRPSLRILITTRMSELPVELTTVLLGSNPKKIKYIQLSSNGSDGDLEKHPSGKINIYPSEARHYQIKEERVKILEKFIEDEFSKFCESSYNPKKALVVAPELLTRGIRVLMSELPKESIIVHNDLSSEELSRRLRDFWICLVTDGSLYGDMGNTTFARALFIGLPNDPLVFATLKNIITDNSSQQCPQIDIIIDSDEKSYSGLEVEDQLQLEDYINRENFPLFIPKLSLQMIRLWIAIGVVVGFPTLSTKNILDTIYKLNKLDKRNDKLSATNKNSLKIFNEAIQSLIQENIIEMAPKEGFYPSWQTRSWLENNLEEFIPTYVEILEQDKKGRTERLGRIRFEHLVKYHLLGQGILFDGKNYSIHMFNKERREVIIKRFQPEFYYSLRNLSDKFNIKDVLACDPDQGLALVLVEFIEYLEESPRIGYYTTRYEKYRKDFIKDFNIRKTVNGVIIRTEEFFNYDDILDLLYKKLRIDPSHFVIKRINGDTFDDYYLFIEKKPLGYAQLIYDCLLKQESSKKRAFYRKNSFYQSEFYQFLTKYHRTFVIIGSSNLTGLETELSSFRSLYRDLVKRLIKASMIFFIGDTISQNESINYLKAADQLHTLYEVLDEYGVFEKTIFLLGDCDYDPDFFIWRKRVNVQSLVKLRVGSSLRLKISHGDDLDIDELLNEGPLTDEKIYNWRRGYIPFDFFFETREKKRRKRRSRGRRKAEQSDQRRVISEEEVRIAGHGEIACCNKKHRLLVVPSIEDYWREKTNAIEIGLIGHGTKENQHEWNMTLLSPFEHKNEKDLKTISDK